MATPVSGPLPALLGYYQRLEDDPNQSVAGFGFSIEKIHFEVLLKPDGSSPEFNDIRDRNERGKPIPKAMLVPDGGGRSGTGLKPFFCWDNTGYTLGRDNKGNPGRSEQMFKAFREFHKSFLPELADDEGFNALCRFLDDWDPARAESWLQWEEAAGSNVVFRLRGWEGHIHESKPVQAAWLSRLARERESEAGLRGVSLLSGEEEELARLHPQISGVAGANTTGAAIVSFNADAFESYGKSQSYNAPVGTRDAFRYTTALNRLLADDARRVRIGDATVIFWSDRAEGAEAEEVYCHVFDEDSYPDDDAEHAATVARVNSFLDAARKGRLVDRIRDPEAPFYILGLSPNASRLNVRYWLAGTVEQFAQRLATHIDHLEMTGARPGDPPLVIRRLLRETVRDAKDIAPQLAGEVARAVLGGFPYPQALFNAVMRRVRADSHMNHLRAAILKAHLVRNRHEEVPVALNSDHPSEAYQLGRLFATLELAQTDALGDINRSIKDSYFSTAAATPATVFPRLLRLHHHHVEKLPTSGEKKRTKGSFEWLVRNICARINHFPLHLPLEKQGLFYIGYYHQREAFFTKQANTNPENGEQQ